MEWTKVLSEEDLPHESCDAFFVPKGSQMIVLGFFYIGQFGDCYFGDEKMVVDAENVSHYQKVQFPEFPTT